MKSCFGIVLLCLAGLIPFEAGAITDPEMEPVAAEVDGRLAILREWWEGEDEDLAKILSAEVVCEGMWPAEDLKRQELPGGMEARFWGRPEKRTTGEGPAAALKMLALPDGNKASRSEIKLIAVMPGEANGSLRTEMLVGLYQFSDSERRETRARWACEWRRDQEELKLARCVLRDYSELRLKGGEPILQDRTTAVLPEASTDASLTHGNFYWRHRIESALQPDPFGQNGVSVADLNGDGRQDVFLAQMGGLPNRVFVQQADGTCVDWSLQSGLNFFDNTTGALFVDFDNDGDQDAAVATSSGLLICENDGSGRFAQRQRYEDMPYVFGMAAADYDGDGDLDLYACQYYGAGEDEDEQRGSIPVPFPIYDANNGGRNALLRNEGKLGFKDVTVEAGLDGRNRRFSFVCLWEDWDRDGDPDLVVVNDFGRIVSYENRSGKFAEDSAGKGFAMSSFGMGAMAADFNRDGWMDLHVANMFSGAGSRITRQPSFRGDRAEKKLDAFQSMAAGNALYLNRAGKTFEETGQRAGVAMGRWSWGCVAPDLNNDGWEDLLVANGFVTGVELDDL